MDRQPLVSVVIPTAKRAAEVVEKTVESALSQDWPNKEVILVNDNPPESIFTEELESLAGPAVRLISTGGMQGAPKARNLGAEHANGELLIFADDDDLLLPGRLTKQVSDLLERDADISVTAIRIVDENDRVVAMRRHPNFPDGDSTEQLRYHLTHYFTGTTSYLIRREVFNRVEGFRDIPMGQEYDLMARILESGAKAVYLPEVLVEMRAWPVGKSITVSADRVPALRNAYAERKQYFPILSHAERRQLTARHHASMAAAYTRQGKRLLAGKEAAQSFFCAPVFFVQELHQRYSQRQK